MQKKNAKITIGKRFKRSRRKITQIYAKGIANFCKKKCRNLRRETFKRSQRKALQIFAKKQKLAPGNVLNIPDAKEVKFLPFETFLAENV